MPASLEATLLPSSFLGDAFLLLARSLGDAFLLPARSGSDRVVVVVVPRLDTDRASASDSVALPLSSPHSELPSLLESEALSLPPPPPMCRMAARLLSFSTTLYANIWNGTSETRGAAFPDPDCHAGLLCRLASMSR